MGVQPKATFSQKIEAIINTANHVAIGTISIYLTVICWNAGPTTLSLHTWLCTIGVSSAKDILLYGEFK